MPWKATSVEDERYELVRAYLRGDRPMTELCAAYGISRSKAYKWVARYEAEGRSGLQDRSRAPHRQAGALPDKVAAALIDLRRAHPNWGPKKLAALLERQQPRWKLPAVSTIGELLKREGLIEERRRRRTTEAVTRPFAGIEAPNDLWCIDFKGHFRTGDGRRCDPLTLSDAVSRYVLECRLVDPTTAGVEEACERVFREFGLPRALRMDNGPPFASSGVAGLTRLSVGWIKLGIELERITPGCPQQNGRHERMHKTLKADTAAPPAATRAAQQRRMNRWRCMFNEERPHEALGQKTPASVHDFAARPYPARMPQVTYDDAHEVRQVRSNGEIKWQGGTVFVSEALIGEPVGIAEQADGNWIVRFANVDLGVIGRADHKLRRFAAARPGRRKAQEQPGNRVTHVPGP